MELFWTWVAAILTLSIYSFLYKDNPFYKIAEHLVVGVSVGYYVVITYFNYLEPNLIKPLGRVKEEPVNWVLLLPVALGVLMWLRISRKYSWLSRFTIAFVMGLSAGLAIPVSIEQRLIRQVEATMFDFRQMPFIWEGLNNLIILIGVLATLIFFFFSKEHKGFLGGTARIGIIFLMVGFGASFGYTVMARISLLIGRLNFLLKDWLHLIG